MTLTQKQSTGLLKASRPLMKWLNKNCHPHCLALVSHASTELMEGIAREQTMDYVLDKPLPHKLHPDASRRCNVTVKR
jgi:hypothetical protein